MNNKNQFKIISLVVFMLFLGMAVVWGYGNVNQLTQDIYNVQKEIELLQGESMLIQRQISEMKSMERIQAVATEELQMVIPKDVSYVFVTRTDIAEENVEALLSSADIEEENTGNTGGLFAFIGTAIRGLFND